MSAPSLVTIHPLPFYLFFSSFSLSAFHLLEVIHFDEWKNEGKMKKGSATERFRQIIWPKVDTFLHHSWICIAETLKKYGYCFQQLNPKYERKETFSGNVNCSRMRGKRHKRQDVRKKGEVIYIFCCWCNFPSLWYVTHTWVLILY